MPAIQRGRLFRLPARTMTAAPEEDSPFTEDSGGSEFTAAAARTGRLLRPFDGMPVMDPVGIAAGIDFTPPLAVRGQRLYDPFLGDGFPGLAFWWEPANYWGLEGTYPTVPRVVLVADDKATILATARNTAVAAALDGLYDDLLNPHKIGLLYTGGTTTVKQFHPILCGCPHAGWTRSFLNLDPAQTSAQVRTDQARAAATGLYCGGEFLTVSLLGAEYSFAGALPSSGGTHEDHFEVFGGYHATQYNGSPAAGYTTAALSTRLAADQAAAAAAVADWRRRGHTYCFQPTVPPFGGPPAGLPATREAYLTFMAGALEYQRIGPDWSDTPAAIAALVRAEIVGFFGL